MDVVNKKNLQNIAEKHDIKYSQKANRRLIGTANETKRMNRRRSKRSGSKARKGSKKRKVVISKHKQPKRSRSDFFAKVKDDQ